MSNTPPEYATLATYGDGALGLDAYNAAERTAGHLRDGTNDVRVLATDDGWAVLSPAGSRLADEFAQVFSVYEDRVGNLPASDLAALVAHAPAGLSHGSCTYGALHAVARNALARHARAAGGDSSSHALGAVVVTPRGEPAGVPVGR